MTGFVLCEKRITICIIPIFPEKSCNIFLYSFSASSHQVVSYDCGLASLLSFIASFTSMVAVLSASMALAKMIGVLSIAAVSVMLVMIIIIYLVIKGYYLPFHLV